MILTDRVKVFYVTGETQSGTGTEKTYDSYTTRGALRSLSPSGAALYQTQGYGQVECELVIAYRKELAKDSVDFAGYIEVTDARTGEAETFDIETPPVRRGNRITVGIKRR